MKIEFETVDGIGDFCQTVKRVPGEYAKILRSMRASGLRFGRARIVR